MPVHLPGDFIPAQGIHANDVVAVAGGYFRGIDAVFAGKGYG